MKSFFSDTLTSFPVCSFVPLREEKYDFLIPKDKMEKPAVKKFLEVLRSEEFKKKLEETPGLRASKETGKVIHSLK